MTSLSSADVLGRVTASEVFRRLKLGNRTTFMIGATLLAILRSGNCICLTDDLNACMNLIERNDCDL